MPKKILVRAPNFIGDQVMARPFYRGLRALYPGATLTLLCTPAVAGLAYPEIFNRQLVLTDQERRHFPSLIRYSRRLKKESFDLAISLPATFRAALLLALSGIPHRVGFSDGISSLFLTDSLPWKGVIARLPKSALYLELLEFLSAHSVSIPAENFSSVQRDSYIVVAPGASIELREWPYFDELLIQLSARFPQRRFLVVGSAREVRWKKRIETLRLPGVEDWVGKTSLLELVDVCRRASVVIANDSGVAHLAATLGQSPTVVLFGPGDPKYVSPEGPSVSICRIETLPCSPCEKSYCRAPYGYQRCLRDLPTAQVMRTVETLLAKIGSIQHSERSL
jgi:heptosyltransferase II